MDFGFTEEQERFRKEIHDFYMNELPENLDSASLMGGFTKEEENFWVQLLKKACKKGWPTASWPKKYGGLGWTSIEKGIFNEEMAHCRARFPSWSIYQIQGPGILTYGTEEQKQKYIPPMIRGEVKLFNAFTEPEAGNETANVQLRAVKDGDYYILNGQKTFISGSHQPDVLYTLAKTADVIPKHRGISLFIIPGDTPGITYRPLPGLFGGAQHDIFFDDVRVHKDCLLGEENRGFYHAMTDFEFERSGTGTAATAKRNLEEFVQFCKEEKRNGKPLIEDPEVRKILTQRALEVEVMRLSGWLGAWWFGERERLGPQPANINPIHYSKMFGEHWAKETTDILNLHGQLKRDSKWSKLGGRIERQWQQFRSQHQGGTIEIYKYTLADRGFGLPRWHRRTVAAKPEERK